MYHPRATRRQFNYLHTTNSPYGSDPKSKLPSKDLMPKGTPTEKKFSFGYCPKRGGEGLARIFLPFFSTMLSLIFWHQYHVMWYFLVIFNTKIIKSTKIMITHIIVVIIILGSVICAKRRFWRPKKVVQLAQMGGRGYYLGNFRKKTFFLGGVSATLKKFQL